MTLDERITQQEQEVARLKDVGKALTLEGAYSDGVRDGLRLAQVLAQLDREREEFAALREAETAKRAKRMEAHE